jgi:predicted TIM-barrel fold metal-dependent hydrolase
MLAYSLHLHSLRPTPSNIRMLAYSLHLQSLRPAQLELTRCVRELKMPGVQIGSHIGTRNLDDKQFDPLWRCAEQVRPPFTVLLRNNPSVYFILFILVYFKFLPADLFFGTRPCGACEEHVYTCE